jgi:MYXO-CTERM domain-containing protein
MTHFARALAAATLFSATFTGANAFAGVQLTMEELIDMEDIAVVADVVVQETTCLGASQQSDVIERTYGSTLQVTEVVKGDVAVGDELAYNVTAVEFLDPGDEPLGCSRPGARLPAGWVGRVALVYVAAEDTYAIDYLGSAEQDMEMSEPQGLPACEPPPINNDLPTPEDEPGEQPGTNMPYSDSSEAGGCSVGGTATGMWPMLAALVGLGLGRRRRR